MKTIKFLSVLWSPTSHWIVLLTILALLVKTPAMQEWDAPKDEVQAPQGRIFQYQVGNHVLGFTPGQVYMAATDHLARIVFVGANAANPQALGSLATQSSVGTPALDQVIYRELWPGIEARFEATDAGLLKVTYTLAPRANPERIRLQYNVPATIQSDGSLRLEFNNGALVESTPMAWQEIDGQRVSVDVTFQVFNERQTGFQVGRYNRRYPLVIDPTYTWHTFYGGKPDQQAYAIAVADDGMVYFTGAANNYFALSENVSPVLGYSHKGNYDIIVGCYTSAGSPSWVRMLGSDKQDHGYGIAVDDNSGHLYVAGSSAASWTGPSGSALNPHSGGRDIVVIRMDRVSGDYLSHAFYGSSYDDEGKAIAISGDGKIVVVGYSRDSWNGPGSAVPLNAYKGDEDIVVLSLTASSLSINMTFEWHTFYGSYSTDIASGVVLDGSKNVYLSATSDWSWNAGTTGPKHAHTGSNDMVVIKLNSSGAYQWHTFYGSGGGDVATSITYNGANLFIGGYSSASWSGDGAITPKHAHSGGTDLAALALSPTGNYLWHTFYGSGVADEARGIAADSGSVYLVGVSSASWNNGAIMPLHVFSADLDVAIVKLNASNGGYYWHTFYGSSLKDAASAVTVTGSRLIVVGYSDDRWPDSEVWHHGGRNTLVVELTSVGGRVWLGFGGLDRNDHIGDMALDGAGNIILVGYSTGSWLGSGNQAPINAHGGVFENSFVLKLDPDGAYLWHAFFGGAERTYARGVAIGSENKILLLGDCTHNWLGPGNTAPIRAHTGDGSLDIFIVSLSASGVYNWHTFIGGANQDAANAIAVSGSYLFVLGTSRAAWLGPGGSSPLDPWAGSNDIMVAKYSTGGTYLWHSYYGSIGTDNAGSLAIDGQGDIYIGGISTSTWYGPSPVYTMPLHAYVDGYDLVFLKLSNSGAYRWHTFYGGVGDDFNYGLVLDKQNNLVSTNRCDYTWLGDGGAPPKYDPNNPSAEVLGCLLSLTEAGAYRWHTFYGGDLITHLLDITIDNRNVIYITGFGSSSWLGPSGQAPQHAHTGSVDIVLIMLDAGGDYIAHDFLGSDSGVDEGHAVAVTSQGALYLGGVSFDSWQGDGNSDPLHAHSGANDILLLRLQAFTKIYLPLVQR